MIWSVLSGQVVFPEASASQKAKWRCKFLSLEMLSDLSHDWLAAGWLLKFVKETFTKQSLEMAN